MTLLARAAQARVPASNPTTNEEGAAHSSGPFAIHTSSGSSDSALADILGQARLLGGRVAGSNHRRLLLGTRLARSLDPDLGLLDALALFAVDGHRGTRLWMLGEQCVGNLILDEAL